MKETNYLKTSRKYKGFHYSTLSQSDFEYLHNRTYEMLKNIVKVFDENGIDYFIEGGTLLGAVTLQDFIPWDDDVDLCVLENQYEKAQNLLLENFSDDVVIQCKKTEQNYFHGWLKVRDANSETEPKSTCYKNNGVWCDIYKVVTIKEKKVGFEKTKEHIAYLWRRKNGERTSSAHFLGLCIKRHLFSKLAIEFLKSIFSRNKNEVFLLRSASGMALNKDWVFPLKKYKFRDLELFGINDAHSYLVAHYGEDYAQFPKDEDRRIGICKITRRGGGGYNRVVFFTHRKYIAQRTA